MAGVAREWPGMARGWPGVDGDGRGLPGIGGDVERWNSILDMAEHTLMTGIRPGRGRTHSADRKSNGMWRNTLCQSEIDPGCGGTHSADRKLTLTFSGGEGL